MTHVPKFPPIISDWKPGDPLKGEPPLPGFLRNPTSLSTKWIDPPSFERVAEKAGEWAAARSRSMLSKTDIERGKLEGFAQKMYGRMLYRLGETTVAEPPPKKKAREVVRKPEPEREPAPEPEKEAEPKTRRRKEKLLGPKPIPEEKEEAIISKAILPQLARQRRYIAEGRDVRDFVPLNDIIDAAERKPYKLKLSESQAKDLHDKAMLRFEKLSKDLTTIDEFRVLENMLHETVPEPELEEEKISEDISAEIREAVIEDFEETGKVPMSSDVIRRAKELYDISLTQDQAHDLIREAVRKKPE